MPYSDIPPGQAERIVCAITAAMQYQVPANIMLAIAEKESGKPGLENKSRNGNGSYDVGPMQFNTTYLRDLAKYGITADDVAQSGCYSYYLAAWRIRGHIKNDRGDIWTKVANYHSKTLEFNIIYRTDLVKKAAKWEKWLKSRFSTFDATDPDYNPVTAVLAAAGTLPKEKTSTPTKTTPANPAQPTAPRPMVVDPSTLDTRIGLTASVTEIPVTQVVQTDDSQPSEKLPAHYNKAAAAALASVFGNKTR